MKQEPESLARALRAMQRRASRMARAVLDMQRRQARVLKYQEREAYAWAALDTTED